VPLAGGPRAEITLPIGVEAIGFAPGFIFARRIGVYGEQYFQVYSVALP
jgi:hypothetical protein